MQRMTKQRQAVLDELTRVSDFRSAQQIFEDLHRQGQRVGLATVYRSLQSLADDGRVDTLRSSDGEALYRSDSVASAHGFSDVEHSLELFGVCSSCQSKQ